MARRLILLLLLAVTGLIVSATSVLAQAPAKTIHWLEWWDPEWGSATLDKLTGDFEAQTGIHVERTTDVGWGAMYDKLVTNAQAGTADYDVLGMEACCFLTGIDKLGGIEPLKPYLDKDADFAKSLTPLTTVNWLGEPMMLNWYVFPYSYTYNVDIFKKAGVEPPKTWNDIIPASKAIRAAGAAGYGLGAGLGTTDNSYLYVVYYMFGSRLASLGGRFFDDQGHAVFNSAEGVAALKWWKDLYDSGELAPGALGSNFNATRELLATGKIAAMWEGPFANVIARQTNPDITLAYPEPLCDKTCGQMWAGSGLAISANSEHKDEAWQFIKYVLSDDVSLWLTKTNGIPFATNAVFESLKTSDDPILKQIPALLTKDSEHNLLLLPTPEYDKLHGSFVEMFDKVMTGEVEPQKALDDEVALWNEEIDKLR